MVESVRDRLLVLIEVRSCASAELFLDLDIGLRGVATSITRTECTLADRFGIPIVIAGLLRSEVVGEVLLPETEILEVVRISGSSQNSSISSASS